MCGQSFSNVCGLTSNVNYLIRGNSAVYPGLSRVLIWHEEDHNANDILTNFRGVG